jgi:hypothetical protein
VDEPDLGIARRQACRALEGRDRVRVTAKRHESLTETEGGVGIVRHQACGPGEFVGGRLVVAGETGQLAEVEGDGRIVGPQPPRLVQEIGRGLQSAPAGFEDGEFDQEVDIVGRLAEGAAIGGAGCRCVSPGGRGARVLQNG